MCLLDFLPVFLFTGCVEITNYALSVSILITHIAGVIVSDNRRMFLDKLQLQPTLNVSVPAPTDGKYTEQNWKSSRLEVSNSFKLYWVSC